MRHHTTLLMVFTGCYQLLKPLASAHSAMRPLD